MKKSILCCLSVFLLVLIAIVCAWAYGYGMEAAEADELHVIFVPGLWTEDNAPEFYEKYLKEAFPGCRLTVKQWKSNRMSWENAREGADLLSADLAKEVYAMTETERRNLVLVGHSIGARVVIRAMADINGYGMNIRRGVFLGAAIPDDDESISKALNASRCPCINISNRKDNVLAVLYSSIMGDYEECALGAYGSRVKYPEMSLVDVKIKPKEEAQEPDENFWDKLKKAIQKNLDNYQMHYAELYFNELKTILGKDDFASLLYPMEHRRRYTRKYNTWKTVSKTYGWELRRHSLTRQLCIVNPSGVMVSVGDSDDVKAPFSELQRQLKDADLWNNLKVEVKQDERVEVEKVLPIDALWNDVDEFDGWLLQRQRMSRTYRIVDPRDFLRASGSKDKMRESFNNIREQLTNGIVL